MKDCEQTIIDERNVGALAHDLEEASTFGSYGYASNQDYISKLLMKRDFGDKQISQYLYADFSSDKNMGKLRLSDAQIINKKENDHD